MGHGVDLGKTEREEQDIPHQTKETREMQHAKIFTFDNFLLFLSAKIILKIYSAKLKGKNASFVLWMTGE